jgi:DNA/RNA endonuclease YhcR with UshA esterase domain
MIRLLPRAARHRQGLAVLAGLVLLPLAACESPSVPEGTPGTVQVRAFVDEDGSGVFTPGTDVPLAGLTILLSTADGEPVGLAETNAEGLAVFSGVRPGGYSLENTTPVPGGAVLASGTRPSVAVPAQGGTVEARFRFVSSPGSIEGRVFRDLSGSGDFDPGTDEPGEGFRVELFRGGDVAGEASGDVVTGADGVFGFEALRPGAWTLRVTPPPPLEVAGGAIRTVTVGAGAATSVDVIFEGDLVLDIADARTLSSGTPVTVEGVVTAPQNTWNPREVMVQDATGGILVFVRSGQSPALELGDRVRVSGTIGFFSGNIQITGNPTVEFMGVEAPPEPRRITGEEMLARTYEGQLVTLSRVTVDSIEVLTFDNHDVFVTAEDGSKVIIRVDSRSGIASVDWTVGVTYQVTGALRFLAGNPRLYPRSTADFFDVNAELGIAQVRALPVGDPATIRGIVTVDQPAFGGRNIFVQDATGGILVFLASSDSGLGLRIGDDVRITGTVGSFNGELQVSGNPTVEILGTATPPAPRPISGKEMITRVHEGELAALGVVTVNDIAVQNFDNHNVFVTTADGSEVVIRVDSRTGIGSARWTVGERYEVTGLLRVFRGLPQLFPRQPADVVDASASASSPAFMPLGFTFSPASAAASGATAEEMN